MKQPTIIVEGIVESIQNRIDGIETKMDDLAHNYIQSDMPFPNELKQRYDTLGEIVDTLHEVLGDVNKVVNSNE